MLSYKTLFTLGLVLQINVPLLSTEKTQFDLFTSPWASAEVLKGAFAPGPNHDPPPVVISDITQEQADALFKEFKANKDISYPSPEGCFAKAMAMARIADKYNIQVGKIFAEGNPDADGIDELGVLAVRSKKHVSILWKFHTATIANVKTIQGGKTVTKRMVFDPYLFDQPVTEAEWTAALQYYAYWYCNNGSILCDGNDWSSQCPKDRRNCEQVTPAKPMIYYGNRFQFHSLNALRDQDQTYRSSYAAKDLQDMSAIFSAFRQFPDGNLDIEKLQKSIALGVPSPFDPVSKEPNQGGQ